MAGVMKIQCPLCGSKAVLRKVQPVEKGEVLMYLFYLCTNYECNERIVFYMDNMRITSPSKLHQNKAITTPEADNNAG